MHKDAYKTIRNDHVETNLVVSKDLKQLQAMVQTNASNSSKRLN